MSSVRSGPGSFARRCILVGAVLMLLGVLCGAIGTHLLAARVTPTQLSSFQAGALYHLLHALGLILVGVIAWHAGVSRWLRACAALMVLGIACFSGAIYLMTLGAPRWLGMIAPVGGLSFMIAWVCLAMHARSLADGQVPGST